MYNLKELIRGYPLLFKFLSYVYQNIIKPFTSKFLLYYFCYLYEDRKSDIVRLKRYNFEEIKQFNPRSWRYGRGKDNAFRRYYIAKLEGEKCFIKIAENDETVKNEIKIHNKLDIEKFTRIPEYKIAEDSFSDTQVMLAIRYIEDLHQIEAPKDEKNLEILCDEFRILCDFLYEKQVVHADIHRGNLLQSKNGRLILLDFGISIVKNVENTVNYVARPGTFFVENGNIREYDDVYSFLKMLDSLGMNEELKKTTPYIEIKSLIGRYSEKVDITDYFNKK